jgi:hypothetical protein
METVKAECGACEGSGIYRGFAEPPGVGVVCLQCNGSGCQEIRYKPFERRKGKRGVHTIRRSAGNFIVTGVGPTGGSVTYAEFQQGKMP